MSRSRSWQQPTAGRFVRQPFASMADNAPRRDLRLLSYDITEEAMPEPDHGGTQIENVLNPQARQELYDAAQNDPKSAIPRLCELIERHPDVPVLYNWLTVAYSVADDHEAADRTAALVYERYPKYLFGRIHLAQSALRAGDFVRFEALFEKKFDLKLLYPRRRVFHISEFLNFSSLIVEYYVRTECDDAAEMLLEIMQQLAPDSPQTLHAEAILERVELLHVMEEAIARLAASGKRRKALRAPKPRKSRKSKPPPELENDAANHPEPSEKNGRAIGVSPYSSKCRAKNPA